MKTTEHYLRVALFVFGLIAELPAKKKMKFAGYSWHARPEA